MGLAVGEFLLQADEIARQHETEDLPAAVAERLVAKGPTGIERVELRTGALLVDDGSTGVDDARIDRDNGRGWITQQVTVFGRFLLALVPGRLKRA